MSKRFFQRFAKRDAEDDAKAIEAAQQRHAEAFNAKPMEEKREEWFSFCASVGTPKTKAEAGWKRYLETGKM